MVEEKRFICATWEIVNDLLKEDNIENALSSALELIVRTLDCEAGAVWILDNKRERLSPVCHIGSVDISDISIEYGTGIEGTVVSAGKSVISSDASSDKRSEGSVYADNGYAVSSMMCVPLNNMHDIIGCVDVINKKNGSFDEDELRLCERMAALAAMTIEEKGFEIDLQNNKEVLASLRNVTKEYPSGDGVIRILDGINLDIYRNEFVVILGESGCGKTTMMNIVGGMDFMTDGSLTVEDRDFSHPSDSELTEYRRQYIGFIFQSYNLMPNLTALENVRFIAELVKDPMPPEEAIERVRMTDRADNYPGQMSGGQQQRVSIARAIVKKPRLILADEPTAALDYSTSIEVLETIEDIVKKYGTTVLMVTHNPEIARMADRVVKMRGGKIASIKRNPNPLHASELVW